MDVDAIDAFIAATREIGRDPQPGRSTSVRRDPAVARAAALAVEVGVAPSINELSEDALAGQLRREAHRLAIEAHLHLYPEDRPSPAMIAEVDLRRAGDALWERRDLLERAEDLLTEACGAAPTPEDVIAAARVLDVADRTAAA